MGGAVEAIKLNFQQDEIARTAYDYQKTVESKENIIVGVNKFENQDEVASPNFRLDENAISNQLKRLEIFKMKRDLDKVNIALNKLYKAAQDNLNLIPFIIKSVESKATLGEISDTLRKVYGEHS